MPTSDKHATAVIGATLIDGTGAEPTRNATVVVDGNRIVAVGPQSSVDLPAEIRPPTQPRSRSGTYDAPSKQA
jgi:hypothetical protein